MIGIGISPFLTKNGRDGVVYDADAQLYFNQLSPQPSLSYKAAIDALVIQLKADFNWALLDRLWIHGTEYAQHATISIKNPTSTAISVSGSPTFTANVGYTGNGTTSYLNLNYNPSIDGVNFTQNSALIGVYSRLVQGSDNSVIMGRFEAGTNTALALNFGALGKLYAANANGQDIFANTTTKGFFTVTRSAAAITNLSLNGNSIASSSSASTALQNGSLYALGWNNNGTAGNFSTNQISVSVIGGAMFNNTLYSAIQTFATTIGFNV